jgi:hypothetical protein
MQDLAPVLIVIGIAATFYWILRTFSDNATRRKLADTRAGVHRDLLAKFGSSQELLAYLSTDAGRELVGASVELERPSPFRRILGAVQTGLVLVSVGIGLLLLAATGGYGSDGRDGFTFLGGMSLAVGLGFLASAAAAWLLSKRWGLIGRETPRDLPA